ncbi:MAG: DUF423 domain-containing protein [bacterium]|nr:DUF423 domain-containing protein [bacterium]
MTRVFTAAAAIFAFLGVAAGAFGTHALRAHFDVNPALEETYRTAALYHLVHALALFGLGWAADRFDGQRGLIRIAGIAFAVGIIAFSGSLYALAIFNLRAMGAVAPVGGAAFLAGWALLAAAALRTKPA